MKLRSTLLNLLGIACLVCTAGTAWAEVTVDRLYLFGDDPSENPQVGMTIENKSPTDGLAQDATADSARVPGGSQTTVDLAPSFAGFEPRYVDASDRPDLVASGGSSVALEFTAAEFDHLRGQRLGTPATSISSEFAGGSINYATIVDRGMQFWTKPNAVPSSASGAPEEDVHIVMDTNNHGALINTFGKYTMRYNGEDFPGEVDAVANEWAHIMVVRPDGAADGARMYVNGIAVAAAPGDYLRDIPPGGTVDDVPDTAPLVIAGGTEPASGFSQGFINNYEGVVDDLEMFVTGLNGSGDLGVFDVATDNDYVVAFGPENPLDLAGGDGQITLADAEVFAQNWLYEKTINGLRIGDLETVAKGDFNYDGIVDLVDWAELNSANPLAGATALATIQSVPEPANNCLILASLISLSLMLRRGTRVQK